MSRPRTDRALFVDLELTCWEDTAPEGEISDIIELGVVEIDTLTLTEVGRASILTRPARSRISGYCADLTGITPERMKAEGVPFGQGCNIVLKRFAPTRKTWYAWGDDAAALARQCAALDARHPLPGQFVNLAPIFCALHGVKDRLSLSDALDLAGTARQGRAHSGVDDAASLAALWIAMAGRQRRA